MAKKDDNTIGDVNEESKGSKLVTALLAIVIILIWLVVFGCLIKFDVGGIGSKVLYPVLKDVPVVNKILPTTSEQVQATQGNYKYNTLEAANQRISELENQLATNDSTSSANSGYISQLEAKVKELQKYKDNQTTFQKLVADFDKKVVYNSNAPSLSEYKKYYESIDAKNAAKIYKQVVKDLQYSARAKELAGYYGKMDPAKAAKALSQMTEDLGLVCDIIQNMSDATAGAVLQEMDSTYAAQITKKISAVQSNN